ncbi:MAG TPA: Calx-beta domain-containing protein [Tepidisphaeraceae bacterium]|nr:Calx-beta domain-containing protein [Tepidisphaeraceae bacterium]
MSGDYTGLGTAITASETIIDSTLLTNSLTGAPLSVTDVEATGPYTSTYANVVGSTTAGTGSFGYLALEVLEFSPAATPSVYPAVGFTVNSLQNLSIQMYNTDNDGSSNYSGHVGNFDMYFIPNTDAASPTSGLKFLATDVGGLSTQGGAGAATLLGTFSFGDNAGYDTFTPSSIPSAISSAIVADLNAATPFRIALTPQTTGMAVDWAGLPAPTGAMAPTIALSVGQTQTSNVDAFSLSPSYTVNENAGTATIAVTRNYTGTGTSDPASIHYATSDGTASAGTNYTSSSGTLNFAAGQSSASFAVPIADLTTPAGQGGNKSLNITLSGATASAGTITQISQSTATLTIVDSYSSPTNTSIISSNSIYTSYVSTTGPVIAPNNPKFLDVLGSGNGSEFGTLDFNVHDGTGFVFDQTQPISAINGITLSLLNDVYAASAAGTLDVYLVSNSTVDVSNDGASTVKYKAADPEGINGQLGTEMLLGTINYTTNLSTTAYTQFTLTTYSQAAENALVSDINTDQPFRFALAAESTTAGASFAGGSNFGSAGTNGLNSPLLSLNVTQAAQTAFSASAYSANENQGTTTITVNRTGSTVGAVSVNYATSDGTAVAGTDYTATSGTLNFSDGQSTATFTIPLLNVNNGAGTKSLNLTLSNPSFYASLGYATDTPAPQATAVLTITDNAGTATAPTLVSSVVGDGSRQRSTISSVTVVFNEKVNFAAGSFTLQQSQDDANWTDVSSSVTAANPSGDGVTWVISCNAGGSLDRTGAGAKGFFSDGIYQLTLHGSAITDAATGSAHYNSGSDQLVAFSFNNGASMRNAFSVLYGDMLGSAVVNNGDNLQFKNTFGSNNQGLGVYNAALDWFGAGVINNGDNLKFKNNFGKTYTFN